MNALLENNQPLLVTLGLTLTHFVWQALALAMLLAIVLRVLRHRSAEARYIACGFGLLAMVACVPATFWHVRSSSSPILHRTTAVTSPDAHREAPSTPISAAAPSEAYPPSADPAATGGRRYSDADQTAKLVSRANRNSENLENTPTHADSPLQSRLIALWNDPVRREHLLAAALAWASLAWGAGVILLGLRLLGGWMILRRWRQEAEPLPESLLKTVQRLAIALGLRARTVVKITTTCSQPLAFGLLRPFVLLPIAAVAELPPDLLEAMIAHELAHIRRYDLWVNVLQRVAEILLFYHPAVWWVSGRMRLERELCCDDLAISATGRRVEYAESLVALAKRPNTAGAAALAVGMLGPRTTLTARVRRVLQLPAAAERTRAWLAGPVSMIILSALVMFTVASPSVSKPNAAAQEPEKSPIVASAPAEQRSDSLRHARRIEGHSLSDPLARQKLSVVLPEVVFPDGSTFEDVIEFLRTRTDLSMDVNWEALSVVGIEKTAALGLNLHNVKFETALTLALEHVGVAGIELGYDVIDNVIRISTIERLSKTGANPTRLEPIGETFTLDFSSMPAKDAIQRFATQTGQPLAGMETMNSESDDRLLNLVMKRPVSFDEALVALDRVLFDLNYWIVRNEHGLVIRQLSEWYRFIPAENWFQSDDEYRAARLPKWEVATIHYTPKVGDPQTLMNLVTDAIPMNGARARLSPDGAGLELSGFVCFIDQQLAVLAKRDVSGQGTATSQPSRRTTALRAIQAGDWLSIRARDLLERDKESDLSQTVDEKGEVYLPSIGKLVARNLTPSALRDTIIAKARALNIYSLNSIPWVFVELEHDAILGPSGHVTGAREAIAAKAVTPVGRYGSPRRVSGSTSQPAGDGESGTGGGSSVPPIERDELLGIPFAQPPSIPSSERASRLTVRAMVDGIVAEVSVREGEQVKKGDLLLKLDDVELRFELEKAEIGFSQAADVLRTQEVLIKSGLNAIPKEDLKKYEDRIKLADLEVRRAQERLQRTKIVSPADGTVRGDPRDLVGRKISAGEELLAIDTPERVVAKKPAATPVKPGR